MKLTLGNLFGNINDPDGQRVLRSLDMIEDVDVEAGDYVFKEGDMSTDFYIIGLGAVEVLRSIDKGSDQKKVLATMGSGDFFGEGALFTDKPRSADIRALSKCRLFKIDKRRFFELLKNNNDVAVTFLSNMLTVVNQRLQHSNKELVILYEVSRLIAEEVTKGVELFAASVLDQLNDLMLSERALFVIMDEELKTERIVAQAGFDGPLPDLKEYIPDYEKVVKDLHGETVHYILSGKFLVLGIKNLEGKLNGMIVLWDKDEDFNKDDVRLCVSVVEQLGHVIQNMAKRVSDEGKDKLGNEFLGF